MHLNIKLSCDFSRILHFSKVRLPKEHNVRVGRLLGWPADGASEKGIQNGKRSVSCFLRVLCSYGRDPATTMSSELTESHSQVIDNEICFKHTEYDSIVDLFNSRAQMHKRVRVAWSRYHRGNITSVLRLWRALA